MKDSSIVRSTTVMVAYAFFLCNAAAGMQAPQLDQVDLVSHEHVSPRESHASNGSPKKLHVPKVSADLATLLGASAGEIVTVSPETSPQTGDTRPARRFNVAAYDDLTKSANYTARINTFMRQLEKLIELARREYNTAALHQFLLGLEQEGICLDVSEQQESTYNASAGNESLVGYVSGEISKLLKKYVEKMLVNERRVQARQAKEQRRNERKRVRALIATLEAGLAKSADESDSDEEESRARKRARNLDSAFAEAAHVGDAE